MPYQYLTFSDLYEEEVRSSAPSSPVMGAASLSPVFLLPSSSSSHASTSYRHHQMPLSSHDRHHHSHHYHHPSHHSRSNSSRARRDVHDHAMLKTFTSDSDDVSSPVTTPPTSSSSSAASSSSTSALHLDILRVFKRKSSKKPRSDHASASDSAFSTPASSRRSSFTSHGFASLHPVSAASSANTSPAISRQVTKMSDYEAMVQRTVRAEQEDEQIRQKELQAYFNQAAETGLSLRRF